MDLLWKELKQLIDRYNISGSLEYLELGDTIKIWIYNKGAMLRTSIKKGTVDGNDFDNNYKSKIKSDYNWDGKPIMISSSRPKGTETYYTTVGDDSVNSTIGDGQRMEWDFSNTDNDITAPTGYKRKRMKVNFIDPLYIKEGALYFFNKLKGSYGDMLIVCPAGEYYKKNDGTLALAASDTVVTHYVNKHPLQGDVPMGDELNTEETQENPIPTNYELWIEITVPDTDSTSNGCVELETYRSRSVIL